MAAHASGPENGYAQTGPSPGSPHSAVRDLIRRIPFLSNLSTTEVVDLLTNSTSFRRFGMGEVLVAQDAEADTVYYLVQGKIRLVRTRPDIHGRPVAVIDQVVGPGALIGRFALIYNLAYTSRATAETDVLTLQFKMSELERLLYRFPDIRPQIVRQSIINRLRTLPLLANVGLVTLSYLSKEVIETTYPPDQVIYTQDRSADHLYLIHKGQVSLYHPRQPSESLWLGTGAAFGFPGSIGAHLSGGSQRYGHWATTTTQTTLYMFPWESIRRVAQRFPQVADATTQWQPYETIQQVSVFDNFTDEQKRKLAGYCSIQHIPQHHLILQQGDIGDSMWILMAGGKAILSALDNNNRALPRIPVDGVVYFHETALRAAHNVRSTVEAEPNSRWLRLHWQDFRRFLEEEGETLLYKLKIQLPEDTDGPGHDHAQDYPWLGKGELLVSINHRHWIALLQKLRVSAFVLLGGLVLLLIGSLAPPLVPWLVGLVLLFLIPTLAWGIIDYLNDYFIITNQRIIQQEKVILTTEYRREALLEQIERVDVQTSFWGNMLGYGTLRIFTAGTAGSILFDLVPNPDALRSTIFRERGLRHQRYRAESRLEIQNALEQRLGLSMELPSRVRATDAPPTTKVKRTGPWQRFWQTVTNRQLNWETTDHIVWRKHWFILLQQIAAPLILLILFIILMIGALATLYLEPLQDLEGEWLRGVREWVLGTEVLLGVIVLGLLGWIAYQIADWWNDTYEITNDRIIDTEKLPLFLREERKEAQLGQIQDVTYHIASPLEMILNYGNVVIRTAATQGAFTFDHVPNPRGVKEEINRRLVEWRRQDELRKTRDQIRDLPDWFELYNRLETGQEPRRLVQENSNPPTQQT